MKQTPLSVLEKFSQAYFKFINGTDHRYLISINGTVITTVITSKEALKEAYASTLEINPNSVIETFQLTDVDFDEVDEVAEIVETEEATKAIEDDVEDSTPVVDVPEVAVPDDTLVEAAQEPVEEIEAPTHVVDNPDVAAQEVEAPEVLADDVDVSKDLPTKKSIKKAKKLAKKLEKIEPPVHTKPYTDEDVANWETPGVVKKPVVEKKAVKKTAKKTTTAKKSAVGATQAVQQIHLETGAVIATFDSVSHAAKETGVRGTNISKVTNGHRKSTGGFSWKKV